MSLPIILFIIAFVIIATLAVITQIRNLMSLGLSQARPKPRRSRPVPHPELVDDQGNLTEEPLLVIRSTTVDEARNRLNQLYYDSPQDEISGS